MSSIEVMESGMVSSAFIGGAWAGQEAALAAARRTLAAEVSGLELLSASLGDAFVEAVERLEETAGRVIVTGMGKSGHIGCKIAATLASTGTPAQFVHPAEASHGDLGMITRDDSILALSNSGNTPELASIIAYSRRFAIPLLAVTSKAASSLGAACDILLLLPRVGEACPLGLAPMTSTTMTLALGDALAVALLERRGFTPEDFQVFHPGGALGRRLIRVSDVMHGEMPLCNGDTPMSEAILLMTARTSGVVGILNEGGRLARIITDGAMRRHMGRDLHSCSLGAGMTPHPVTINPGALGAEAVKIMNAKGVSCLFVEEAGRLVGLVRLHDLLREGAA